MALTFSILPNPFFPLLNQPESARGPAQESLPALRLRALHPNPNANPPLHHRGKRVKRLQFFLFHLILFLPIKRSSPLSRESSLAPFLSGKGIQVGKVVVL